MVDYQTEYVNRYIARQTKYIQELTALKIHSEVNLEIRDLQIEQLTAANESLTAQVEELQAKLEGMKAKK